MYGKSIVTLNGNNPIGNLPVSRRLKMATVHSQVSRKSSRLQTWWSPDLDRDRPVFEQWKYLHHGKGFDKDDGLVMAGRR